ncbi:MAG: hypothetical protein K0R71_199 [Bacillales bacterium]|jgi:hypothetical protein|nr:hypothetical protein [Bacillales bacterium]
MDNNHEFHDRVQKSRSERYKEEMGAEFVEPSVYHSERNDSATMGSGATWAFVGIVFAVLSLFWMPTTFAIIGIFLGIVGFAKQSTGLGITAIVIGVASLIMQFIWTPFNWM